MKETVRVLLVNPYNVGRFGLQNIFQAEPLGLEYIAAAIQDFCEVYIQDMRWEPDLEHRIERLLPDVVGISCLYTSHTGACWDIARRVKAAGSGIVTVVGGQPPSLGPQFFHSSDIDYIVNGDGEQPFRALCRALEDRQPPTGVGGLIINTPERQIKTQQRARPKRLSDLHRPLRSAAGITRSRHFLSFARPVALMEITRGCPFDCSFCSIWKMADGRVVSQTVESAVQELRDIDEQAIFFTDDHFFANPKLMRELGEELIAQGVSKTFNVQSRADVFVRHPDLIPLWKTAGLNAVFLGLEGHTDKRLFDTRKRTQAAMNQKAIELLQQAGIGVVGNLMVDPSFTAGDFRSLQDYVAENDFHFASFCIATPFPGTDLWHQRRSEIATWDFELFDIQHAVMKTALPLEEFYQHYAALWRQRKAITPATTARYKLRRVLEVLFKEGLNFELLNNVRRFERRVVDPAVYLEDHAAQRKTPWTDAQSVLPAQRRTGTV